MMVLNWAEGGGKVDRGRVMKIIRRLQRGVSPDKKTEESGLV